VRGIEKSGRELATNFLRDACVASGAAACRLALCMLLILMTWRINLLAACSVLRASGGLQQRHVLTALL
jgi:hypothetical protein